MDIISDYLPLTKNQLINCSKVFLFKEVDFLLEPMTGISYMPEFQHLPDFTSVDVNLRTELQIIF